MNEAAARALIARLEGTSERLRTPCGTGSMHWRAWGEGEPLVLLHGGFGSWTHWVRNVEALAARFRVIAADLPALGDSDVPPEPITPASLGAIVAGGLERVLDGAPAAHLAGFSFGGLVAGQVAAALGDRAATLTLVGASGLGPRRPPLALVRRHESMDEDDRTSAIRANLRALMLHADASVDALALVVHAENDRRARLRSRPMSVGTSLLEVLPRVSARLHGIWGEHDATAGSYLPERRSALAASHPEIDFRVVPGAGHWVQFEASEGFNAIVLEMLAR